MATKGKELMKAPSQEVLDALAIYFPQDEGFASMSLPRISFVSQDATEKVKKNGKTEIKVVVEAGTFFTEKQTDEVDEETGKNKWEKTELGTEVELQVVFQRKQLKYYDQATKSFVSSNVYDDADEEVVLFQGKTEIARGTPQELKKKYEYKDERTGKVKSALEDNRVLYVLLDGVLHQLNIRGTSMYAWLKFARGVRPSVPAVIISVDSEPMENGSTQWNCMKFAVARAANAEEAAAAVEAIKGIMENIGARKERTASKKQADEDFENFGKE